MYKIKNGIKVSKKKHFLLMQSLVDKMKMSDF